MIEDKNEILNYLVHSAQGEDVISLRELGDIYYIGSEIIEKNITYNY